MTPTKVTGAAAALLFFGTFFATTMPVYGQRGEEGGKPDEKQAKPAQPQPQRAQAPAKQQAPQRAQEPARQAQKPAQRAPQSAQGAPQPAQRRGEQPAKQQVQQRAQQPAQQHAQPPAQQQVQRVQQPAQQQRAPQPVQQSGPQRVQQQPPQRTEQQARSWQQQKGFAPQGSWRAHASFQQSRSQNWSSDHRDWGQRGGYGGYYIPQATFSLSFGSGHFFRMGEMPVMYMGYPRFAYGGFSFLMVDPWPGDWDQSWYSNDDVYVDWDSRGGGYYLYNRRYPRERVAISVLL